ncbi:MULTISPECIES: methyltransferase domain-containing protein [unclassified Ruegeria]|uniref:methyltransferase domain-containing protein n=1 Tax=unclassified Ruegeria TaxID=2625375 RepID=UPI0014884E3A|nr:MULTISPECIES: methyltransferase domain-containing protein [unclassified Ruegeria]
MLKFDAETTKILDMAYQGADVIKRRRASFDALAPCPGETILDIGCGNGLLTAELARAVGPEGKVLGVDQSADMLAAAKQRCAEFQNVEFHVGLADALPLADGVADKAVSVQVFEYLENMEPALSEALRCLKPNGRLVISDLHFDSLVWFSQNVERMNRMLASWDAHFAAGDVPARLPGLLRKLRQTVEGVETVTLTDHVLKPDGLAVMMMHLMRRFAIDNQHMPVAEADAWFDEQHQLAREGRFFFSITQFVTIARKSG